MIKNFPNLKKNKELANEKYALGNINKRTVIP